MKNLLRNTSFLLISVSILACSGVKGLKEADLGGIENLSFSSTPDSLNICDLGWWEFYSDSALRVIIQTTLDNNRDLLRAAARVEEARALYGVDKSALLPQVSFNAGADYETNDYYHGSSSQAAEYDLKLTVAWEANLWGSQSWSRRRSGENFLATVEDERAIKLALISEVASAYYNLLALDNELAIVRRTLVTRNEALKLATIRYEGGLTSEIIPQQARVEFATTAAMVPNIEQKITVARNAIHILMGEYPADHLPRTHLPLESVITDDLPVGIPSNLLTRRPDFRASEHRLKAAMANVGVMYADRFPNFKIALTGGFENDELSHLIQSPYSYTIGSITGSILDFGRKKKRYQASIAAFDQARLAYEQAVLNAFREALDAITTFQKVREAAKLKEDLRNAAKKYVELAHIQYIGGALNYLDMLDAQRRYFEAQTSFNNALRDEFLAMINLYKVLGGGWKERME